MSLAFPMTFGNQTISRSAWRLTALRPYLAAGLPLSCATIFVKTNAAVTNSGLCIKQYLALFVNNLSEKIIKSASVAGVSTGPSLKTPHVNHFLSLGNAS